MAVRGDLIRGNTSGGPGQSEEGLSRHHIAVLAQQDVDQLAITIDSPVTVAPVAANLQVGLIDVPLAATDTVLAMSPAAEFVGQ